ncbi:hypothetical protein RD110_10995 [Rhodoferax koreense]|uniref:Uncharacterized protein n=1 Tax=Rhodoferax koreensis TaxID=1842727 RepID=A0A1P8JV79_9BURK|nr:hypothetical protein [Rhodoferax koreense]APW37653.1 hypothetical protein RD110_10995 [Rhodoferax koreense]
MSLATYSDLLASVAAWANRADLDAIIPDFVTLAEARINRDLRLRMQLVSTTFSTVGGTRSQALPSDWLEFQNLDVSGGASSAPLNYVPLGYMEEKFPDNGSLGKPSIYTLQAGNFLLAPTPDIVYTLKAVYYAKFPALSVTPTNWLLTNHPSVYLNACMKEFSLYTMNDERAARWEAMYKSAIKDVQDADDSALSSGSALRVRAG